MAEDKIEYSRLILKRSAISGELPTIPTGTTLNEMVPTDLFIGEMFVNTADDLLWVRTENQILPISLSGSTGTTTPTLLEVLFEGNSTGLNDIIVSSGATIQYEGLDTGTTNQILGLDSSGNTIITSVSNISGGRTYFFNSSVDSDITDYKELSEEPTTATTQTTTVELPGSSTNNYIGQFITPELGFNIIPSGIQRFYLNFLKPAENDDISVYVELQLTDFSGSTIGTPIISGIENVGWNGTSPYEVAIDIPFPTTTISPTNRMSVKIYANNDDSTTHNLTFYTEGNEYSFVITTVSQSQQTSSLGTHFGFNLNKNLYYNLQEVSDVIINYGVLSGVRVHPFVPKQTLTINQLSLYATSTGTTQIKIVCYNDVDGTPRDLLFESPIITASTIGNYIYDTSYTFNAGTTYWIGTYGEGTTLFQAHDKLYVNPIGQGTGGATANYTQYVGTSTFPNDVSTFPSTTQYTNGSLINIRFKFD